MDISFIDISKNLIIDISSYRVNKKNYGLTSNLNLVKNYKEIEEMKIKMVNLSTLLQTIFLIFSLRILKQNEKNLIFSIMEFGSICLTSLIFNKIVFSRLLEIKNTTLFLTFLLNTIQIFYSIFYLKLLGRNLRNETHNMDQLEVIIVISFTMVSILALGSNIPLEPIYVFLAFLSYLWVIKSNYFSAKMKSENFYFLLSKPIQIFTVVILIEYDSGDERMLPKSDFSLYSLKKYLAPFLIIYLSQWFYHPKLCMKKSYLKEKLRFQPLKIEFSDLDNFFKGNEKKECLICLEEFKENVEILLTSCKHLYHKDCLERWLIVKPSCPFCREKVVIFDGELI